MKNFLKNANQIKKQVTDAGKEILNQAGNVKKTVEKTSQIIDKKKIADGIAVAAKGVDIAVKGARTAANTAEKANKTLKDLSNKLKK